MHMPNKQKKATAGIYTVLSLLVIVLVILCFFNLIARRTEGTTPGTDVSTDAGTDAASERVTTAPPAHETKQPEPADTTAPVKPPVQEQTEPAAAENAEPATPASIDSLTFVSPIAGGTVTKGFSDTAATFSLTMNDYRVHRGVDYYAPVGTHVLACADGVISNIYEDPFLGFCIRIDHGAGLESVYCNLSAEMPAELMIGCAVVGGEAIGGVGETMVLELADSPHLHFEMLQNGTPIDPLEHCPAAQSASVEPED